MSTALLSDPAPPSGNVVSRLSPEHTPHHQDRKPALLVASLIAGLISYDFASTNVAVATLRDALGFSAATLPWIISAYTLTFGGFLLLAGRLGDVFGRRNVLLAGLAIYLVFSLISAASDTVWLFLVTRVAKGIGAALLAPNALALINSLYSEGKDRHGALASYAVVGSAGYAIGNFLGGVLTSYSWRTTVLVSVLFSLITLVLAWRGVRATPKATVSGGFDYLGAISSTLAFGALIFGVNKSLELGVTSPITLGFIGLSIASFAFFFYHINRHPFPLLPPRLLRARNVIGAGGVVFFLIASGNATFFQISLFMQDVLHYTPKETGIGLIPFVLVALLASFYVHKPLNRFGPHKTLVVSLVFVLLFVLSFLNLDSTSTYWLGLIPGLVLWDLAFPFAYISTRVPAGAGLSAEDQGIANGINFSFEQLGSAFGISVLAAVNTATRTAHGGDPVAASVAGYHGAFIVSGVFMLLAILIAALVIRPQTKPAVQEERLPDFAPLGGLE